LMHSGADGATLPALKRLPKKPGLGPAASA
jgi:hypothetical protein